MMMTDIKATKIAATGALGVGPQRIKALSWKPAAAGTITIRDGGAGGPVVLILEVDSASTSYMNLPGAGIRCTGDPHVTLAVVTSLTVFHG